MAADLYSAHSETIEAALAQVGRMHRLSSDAHDEFCSWARIRLLDRDQAILRKFQGRSSLRTFLITVVGRLYLDWRNAEWGKWRPTAEARRAGSVGIELERMILRDQLTYEEATEALAARGLASQEECGRVWATLAQRPPRRHAGESALHALAAAGSASDRVMDAERQATATRASAALEKAMGQLSPGDQVLVRLRFADGVSVARIAQMTGEDQKALYRRFERVLGVMRQLITAEGVDAREIAPLLGDSGLHFGDLLGPVGDSHKAVGKRRIGPSPIPDTGGEHG